MISALRAQQALAELELRRRRRNILSDTFPKQRRFLESKVRQRAACCSRRAGKSYGIGLLLFQRALAQPNVTCLYAALTRESAKRIMWRDVLMEIDRNLALGAKFNETTATVTLPNGSCICLIGADATKSEAAKLKGQKPVLAVVDECQDFRTDLRRLCRSVLKPALVDNRGDLLLAGVPGNIKNFFFDVTAGHEPGWEVHHWTAADNPHIKAQWEAEIAELVAANPLVRQTPWFQQEYLGIWVVDPTLLVYPGYSKLNEITEQPDMDTSWHFGLGVDLGHSPDATSIVLGAWSDYDPTLYLLKARSRRGLDITDVANWIKTYEAKFPIESMRIDGAAKQAVEELRRRHGLALTNAEKAGKADAQGMMSADLTMLRIKVLMPHCEALTEEWKALIWDERKMPKRVEHPGCDNHASDAALYLWRAATNYSPLERPRVRGLVPQTNEEMEAFHAERDAEQAEEER